MKHKLTMILFLVSLSALLSAYSFTFVGKEENNRYSKLNELYPPIPTDLVNSLNTLNLSNLLSRAIGDLYMSHGCIHVAPAVSYILYSILPISTPVYIKIYRLDPPANSGNLPDLTALVLAEEDLQKLKTDLQEAQNTKVVIYPHSMGILYLSGKPLGKFAVMSGPEQANYPLVEQMENALTFDKNLASPTPDGPYKICKKTDYFYAALYPEASLIEQDTQVAFQDNSWRYWNDKKQHWEELPKAMAKDLERPDDQYTMLWYDLKKNKDNKVYAAKWGGHPFGKHAMLLMDDTNTITSYLIHTNGQLLLEEQELLYYLTEILASSPQVSWAQFVAGHYALGQMKDIADFVKDPINTEFTPNQDTSIYKFANQIPLSYEEKALIPDVYHISQKFVDSRGAYIFSANEKKQLNQWGMTQDKNLGYKLYGIYYDMTELDSNFKKTALWYTALANNWTDLSALRNQFDRYFSLYDIASPGDRGKIIYNLLLTRLRYSTVSSLQLGQPFKNN